ncbi:MAG: metallophosphoesterase family protein [Clostridia bacterium]|nr:metallophosphoesterase family protein [Clostridia bacterium]
MNTPLRFSKNGKFKIMICGDPHVKADLDTPLAIRKDFDTQALLKAALDETKPDLVVLMGDIISAKTVEEYRKCFMHYTRPIRERNIPLAYVNGNHDHDRQSNVSMDEMLSVFQEYENCVAFNATPEIENSINYYVNILSSDSDTPKQNLWFIDSNNLYPDSSISKYDCVHDDQIEWYEKTAAEFKEANGGKPLKSMLFQHIPVPEVYNFLRVAKPWELPVAVKGHGIRSDKYYVLREGIKGYMGEGPCTPCINNGQFASWKKTGDIVGAFFGHDHMNDFEGYVDGIYMAQNKLAGLFAYTDGCRCGVRLVTLNENDPHVFNSKMIRFKELGLSPTSLGPVTSWMSDRVSVNLTIARNVALVAGGVIAAGVITKKIIDKNRKDK